jgi:thiamine-monophosphate kinase
MSKVRRMLGGSAEDRLIARYFRPLAKHPGAFRLTDDAAALTPPSGSDLVVTVDAIIGRVHFLPDDPPELVAKKALRVNLSDLAAKGARPAGFMLTLALPKDTEESWIESFARGLGADAKSYGCPLLGGDSVRTPGPVAISITAFGTVPKGTMVRRAGARPGDRLVVTGTIGDAALGLLVHGHTDGAGDWTLSSAEQKWLVGRYLVPQPRNALAEAVRRNASAAMDVSDGLAGDLAKLCAASGVSADVEVARVPLSPAARHVVAAEPGRIETVLTGGDDYEIVCAVPPRKLAAFRAAAAKTRVPVAEIGVVTKGHGPPRFLDSSGNPLLFKRLSFSHF